MTGNSVFGAIRPRGGAVAPPDTEDVSCTAAGLLARVFSDSTAKFARRADDKVTPPGTAPPRFWAGRAEPGVRHQPAGIVAATGPRHVHLFAGQGDFPLSPLLRAGDASGFVRRIMGEVLEEVDQVAARRGLPLLAPWLLGTAPPSGRDLAEAPVGTAQLALFGASVTIHRALSERLGPPDAVVGVSFGEIAALTAAGVFDIAQGAAIAWELGRILTSSCPGGLALLGCGESAACSIASQADSRDVVVACVNDPQESVVSGPSDQLALVEKRAAGLGIAAVRLRLPFSSHHPALGRQAKEFAQVVRRYPVRRMTCVVLSAVARRPYVPDDDLAARLADCLMRPAHVPDAIALAAGHTLPGQRLHLFEAGTGSALATNARRILAGQPATVHAPLADPGFSW